MRQGDFGGGQFIPRTRRVRAVVPATASSTPATTLPYPLDWPRGPVVSYRDETRKWPGGVICIPAYQYDVGTGVVGAALSGVFAWKNLAEAQNAANFAAAANTISIPIATAGIPTGQAFYVYVGSRVTGSKTTPKVETSAGVGFTPVAQANYGLQRIDTGTFTFTAGQSLDIKAYAASGAGTIDLDNVYLVPAGTIQTGVDATYYPGLGGNYGPTSSIGSDSSVHCASGTSTLRDSQFRRGLLDPNRNPTMAGIHEQIGYAWTAHDTDFGFELMHPRHGYALARINGPNDLDTSSEFLYTGGFISMFSGGIPEGFAALTYDSWGLVYLGLVGGARRWGEQTLSMWIASNDDGDYKYADTALLPEDTSWAECANILYPSSRFDWDGYLGAAEFAYLTR